MTRSALPMKLNPRLAATPLTTKAGSYRKKLVELRRRGSIPFTVVMSTSVIGYCLSERSPWLALSLSAVPGVILFFCALHWHSSWFLLGSTCALTTAVTENLYSHYVVLIVYNDFATVCPFLALGLVGVVNKGTVESTRVQTFYLTVFQAFITVLGIVFTFGVFLLQTQNFRHAEFLRDALIAFSCLYALVVMLTLVGIILPSRDINLSHQHLDAAQADHSNWLNVAVFFATYCLTAASAAYLVFLFLIFLK